MKKLFCSLLCLTLIFSSISFCFATPVSWDSSDSQHLTEIRNTFMSGGGMYNIVNAVNTNLTIIDSHLNLIYQAIDPSSSGSTASILNKILSMLAYTDTGGALKSWLADIWQINSVNLPRLNDIYNLDVLNGFESQSGGTSVTLRNFGSNGSFSTLTLNLSRYNWRQNIPYTLLFLNNNLVSGFNQLLVGNSSTQTAVNWYDLSSKTFTPSSTTNGIYQWLSNIQAPVARLSYVLASDERIAAQEAAAANEEAVVDNFIDSSGDGSASPSDIGSVSDLSSGYKQNFGSDASVSGIFNIFDSNNMGWFSQDTKNQLDTTAPTRLTKGSESETPLLDKQIEDIYNALGVKQP